MAKKKPKTITDKLNVAYADMKKKDRTGGCNCNGKGTCSVCKCGT
jgi:hypothetical protein